MQVWPMQIKMVISEIYNTAVKHKLEILIKRKLGIGKIIMLPNRSQLQSLVVFPQSLDLNQDFPF